MGREGEEEQESLKDLYQVHCAEDCRAWVGTLAMPMDSIHTAQTTELICPCMSTTAELDSLSLSNLAQSLLPFLLLFHHHLHHLSIPGTTIFFEPLPTIADPWLDSPLTTYHHPSHPPSVPQKVTTQFKNSLSLQFTFLRPFTSGSVPTHDNISVEAFCSSLTYLVSDLISLLGSFLAYCLTTPRSLYSV